MQIALPSLKRGSLDPGANAADKRRELFLHLMEQTPTDRVARYPALKISLFESNALLKGSDT